MLTSRAGRDGRRSTTQGLIWNLEGEFRNILVRRGTEASRYALAGPLSVPRAAWRELPAAAVNGVQRRVGAGASRSVHAEGAPVVAPRIGWFENRGPHRRL
jgi:hypothetical protein